MSIQEFEIEFDPTIGQEFEIDIENVVQEIFPNLINLEVTPNEEEQVFKHDGEYGYDQVKVNPIPNEYLIPDLQEKEVTPTKSLQQISADSDYDGLSNVIVNPIPNEYIIPSGTLDITENGSKDVTDYANVNVDIQYSLQSKSLDITENGEYNITPDEGYDALDNVIVTVDAIENLEEELVVYDTELTEQEDLLEGIETLLANKQGGGSIVNIFMQSKEPTKKDGIWFETGDYKYQDIAVLDKLPDLSPKEWKHFANNRDAVYQFPAAAAGNYIYVFGGKTYSSGGTNWSHKFNCESGAMGQLAYCTSIKGDISSTAVIGDNIYFLSSWSDSLNYATIQKYSITNNTYSNVIDTPSKIGQGKAVVIGTDIYIVGGRDGYNNMVDTMYKFDTLTNTITTLKGPAKTKNNYVAAIGTDIYIFGDSGTSTAAYKYDTLTNTSVQIADLPEAIAGVGTALTYKDKIYLFYMQSTDVYRYDPVTDTYELVPILQRYIARSYSAIVAGIDGFYDICGRTYDTSTATSEIYKFPYEYLDGPSFNSDTIMVLQTEDNPYATELITPKNIHSYSNRLLTSFNDVSYYNAQEKALKELPTYYGDGNAWVKIKN